MNLVIASAAKQSSDVSFPWQKAQERWIASLRSQ
jgi:hypothetical protein